MKASISHLKEENQALQLRLTQAEELLEAIRNGEVDAIVMNGSGGEKIYSLHSAETPYRIILEEMNEGAITVSSDGLILFCNRRFSEMVNIPLEQIPGSVLSRFFNKIEQSEIQLLLKKVQKKRITKELIYKPKGKEPLCLRLSFSRLHADLEGDICVLVMDITELKKNEEFTNRIIASSQDCIKVLDLEGNLIFINEGGQKTLEIEELNCYLNKPWINLWKGKERQEAIRAIAKAKNGKSGLFTGFYRTEKGTPKWWDVIVTPILNAEGIIERLLIVSREITERIKIENELKESEKKIGILNANLEEKIKERTKELQQQIKETADYKFAIDEASIVAITDESGIIKHVNDNLCKISKYSREELIGVDYRMLNSGHHSKAFIKNLWDTITRGKIWKGEIKNKAKDGNTYWVDTTIVPFLNNNGKPYQYIAIRADITEHKKTQEKLFKLNEELEQKVMQRANELLGAKDELAKNAEQIRFLATVADNIQDPVISSDTNFKITKWNKAAEDLLEWKCEEVIGKNSADVLKPIYPGTTREELLSSLIKNDFWKGEGIFYTKSGNPVNVLNTVSFFKDSSGITTGYFAVSRDITDLKKAELELIKTKDFLLQTGQVAQLGGWDFDNLTGEISWSDVVCDINEVPHGFVPTYEQVASSYTPESWVQLEKAIHEALTNGTPYDLEVQIITAKGKLCWIRAIGNSEFKDGKCVRLFGVLQNINDRKKAELVLQESEKKFRGLFENLIDEVHLWKIVKDKTGKIAGWQLVDANPAALKAWGKSINEVIGKTSNEIFGTDAHAQFLPIVEEIFKTNKPYHWENYFSPTGQYLSMESIPFGDYFISTGKDITRQKQSEQALKDSELRLTSIFENSPAFIFEVDTDFNYTFLNKIQPGLKFEDIIGHSIYEFVPEEYKGPYRKLYNKAIETGLPQSEEILGVGSFGEASWYSVTINPFLRSGVLVGFIGISNDITALKKSEIEMDRLNRRLFLATESAGMGIWDWDLKKDILTWDDGMFKLYGIEKTDFGSAYASFLSMLHPEDKLRVEEDVALAIAQKKLYDSTFRTIDANSNIKYLKATAVFEYDEVGKPIRMIGVNWDITAIKKAEAEIKLLNEDLEKKILERTRQLESTNQELESFSYSVSHDLRAPLRAVNSYAQIMVEEHAKNLNEDGHNILESIRYNGQKMGKLIDELLEFSKLGRKEPEREIVQLDHLLERVIADLNQQNQIRAAIKISPLPNIMADNTLLYQVFYNLLSNAIKYSSKKECPVIEVFTKQQNDKTVFVVKDNGAGFDMQYADKLFGVFQRLHSEKQFDGNGVGLAIVERIITKFRGRIWAKAQENEGATFYFTLN